MGDQIPAQLRIALIAPETARVGENVPFVIRVENVGDTPITLYLRGRSIAFDLLVRNAAGEPVWRLLEHQVVPAIIQVKSLVVGEAFELSHDWNTRDNRGSLVEPGSYEAQGTVLTDRPEPLESPVVTVRITSQ